MSQTCHEGQGKIICRGYGVPFAMYHIVYGQRRTKNCVSVRTLCPFLFLVNHDYERHSSDSCELYEFKMGRIAAAASRNIKEAMAQLMRARHSIGLRNSGSKI